MKTNTTTYRFCLLSYLAVMLCVSLASSSATAKASSPVSVTLGTAVVPLNGPWKFHTGDDPLWAQADFDDSSWETVDLTPPPGARDSDVGLTGYVPGWQARGHHGYFGYAWYRIHVSVGAAEGEPLAICGPFYVDSAYQVFVNGRLLGGAGDFSTRTPIARNMHFPKTYSVPSSVSAGPLLIAIRVWMGPWALGDPEAGGIHIAPLIGTMPGVTSQYQLEWKQMINGYMVDATEAVLFLLLAGMVCTLTFLDRFDPAYLWFAAALVLIALARGNQAVFFWGDFESIQGFELSTIVCFVPLSLAAWTLAWCYWLRLRERAWMPAAVGVLALLYVIAQFLQRSWFYGVFPHWVGVMTSFCVTSVRLLFVLLTLLVLFRLMFQAGREKWFVLPVILPLAVGLFARELVKLHIPGIWFPFGVGVSLSEYAYVLFDVALFILLLYRLHATKNSMSSQIEMQDAQPQRI